MMGREPDDDEIEQGLFAVAMLIDTVVGTINVDNPVYSDLRENGLTRDELEGVFTREITNWGELVESDVDEPIYVYGRSDSSAAYKQWGDFLGGEDDAYTENELEDFADGNFDGDQQIAQAINNDSLGMSMNNINYVYDFNTGRPYRCPFERDVVLVASKDGVIEPQIPSPVRDDFEVVGLERGERRADKLAAVFLPVVLWGIPDRVDCAQQRGSLVYVVGALVGWRMKDAAMLVVAARVVDIRERRVRADPDCRVKSTAVRGGWKIAREYFSLLIGQVFHPWTESSMITSSSRPY